jgi:hypothetical protein
MARGCPVKLTPKNWSEFQHYKDRSPSWIKLHRQILDDYDFACLPVASKALAPMLWLLASEYEDGVIDASLEKLAFRFRMTTQEVAEALNPLVEASFFAVDQDASKPLADRKRDACLEKEKEKEKEKEQKIDSAGASVHAEFLKMVGSDHDDPTLFGSLYGIQGMLARGFSRETILAGAANGMRGKARPPNWNYFAKCIESENEQRSAPAKKEIANANSGNVIAAADKLIERMRQFDEPVRSGTSPPAVRLLSQGRSE